MRALVVALLLAAAVGGRAQNNPGAAILNGWDAPKGRLNWITQLVYPYINDITNSWKKGEYTCVASLIAPDVLLTSEVCAFMSGLWPEARLGAYYRARVPGAKHGGVPDHYESRRVAEVLIQDQDTFLAMTLMKLDRRSHFAFPIIAAADTNIGTKLSLAGWGAVRKADEEASVMAPNLKKTTAYRQLNDKCAVLWGEPETFANGDSICAAMPGYAAGATCIGDQGAPLYAQSANPRRMPDVLGGIEIWSSCNPEGSVFANVAKYRDWIYTDVKILQGKVPNDPTKYWHLQLKDYPPLLDAQQVGRTCRDDNDCVGKLPGSCYKDEFEEGFAICLPPSPF